MKKHNQVGAIGLAAICLIITGVLLFAAVVFGAWAFSSRQNYKNNDDQLIAVAVAAAKKQEGAAKDQFYQNAAKQPLASYTAPEQFGSVMVKYPKTWSLYDNSASNNTVNWYFDPSVVPSVSAQTSIYALQVQVLSQAYSSVLQSITSLAQGSTPSTITAYTPPLVPNVVGVEVTGNLPGGNQTGTMVVLPVRGDTLEIWTEGTQYLNDFNNNILPNFTFEP